MSQKQAAIAQVACELAYESQKVDPKRKQHSSNLINKAKDEIHRQHSHLGLDKYKVENSNRDCFTMRNDANKTIYIGVAGTRIDGSWKTAVRDLINDVSIMFTGFAFATRTNTTYNYIQNVAKKYPGYNIIVAGHSLGGNTAETGTHYVNRKGYNNVRAISFNAGDSPLAYIPMSQDSFVLINQKQRVNCNQNITRYQHQNDPIGAMNMQKPNCQILRTDYKGLQAHSLERFNYLRNQRGDGRNNLNNSGNGPSNLMDNYGKNQNFSLNGNNKVNIGDFFNGKGVQNQMRIFSNLQGNRIFEASVGIEGLIDSYNNYTLKEICKNGFKTGQIGGVAVKPGIITNLEDSEVLLQDQFIFAFQDQSGICRIKNEELNQLMRELAVGIFHHRTFPFFSLHFNEDANLYPVIHPAYQNTLVGETICYLDYFLKGYLNGGIYSQQFLQQWFKNPNRDRQFLKSKMIDLKKYCKQIGSDIDYHSLRQILSKSGLENKNNEEDFFKNNFRTSFRIIGNVKNVRRSRNLFVINSDFDVQYTIDVMPDYKKQIEKQLQQKGKQPEKYILLEIIYKQMTNQIKSNMPKIPLFADHFRRLKIIAFLSSYYSTLIDMGHVPALKPIPKQIFSVPPVFPPIPVRYYQHVEIKMFIKAAVRQLKMKLNQHKKNTLLDEWFIKSYESMEKPSLPNLIPQILAGYFELEIMSQLSTYGCDQIDKSFVTNMIKIFSILLNGLCSIFQEKIQKNFSTLCEQINNVLKHKLRFEKLSKFQTLRQQFNYIYSSLNRIRDAKIQKQIEINLEEAKKGQSQKISNLNNSLEDAKKNLQKNINDQLLPHGGYYALNYTQRQKIDQIKQKDRDEFNRQYNINLKNIRQTFSQIRKNIQQQVTKNIRQRFVKIYDFFQKIQKEVRNVTDHVISSSQVNDVNLAQTKYLISRIVIADANYYKDAGDNLKIVGGCGLKLPHYSTTPCSFAGEFIQQINTKVKGNQRIFNIQFNNKKYFCFKTASIQHITSDDYGQLKNYFKHPQVEDFSEKQIQYIESLVNNSVNEKQIDLSIKNKDGKNLAHFLPILIKDQNKLISLMRNNLQLFKERDLYGNLPIHTVCEFGSAQSVQAMIRVDRAWLEALNNQLHTPLLKSIAAGNQQVVKKLIDLNANINYQLPNTINPLFLALQLGKQEISRILVTINSINISLKTSNGQNSLFEAINMGFNQVCKLIIAKTNDFSLRSKSTGYNVLNHATFMQNYEIVDAILTKAAKIGINIVDSTTIFGQTALYISASKNYPHIFKLLIEKYNANPNIVASRGQTPFTIALKCCSQIAYYMLARKIPISINNASQVLNTMAKKGEFQLSNFFIQHKKITVKQNETISALLLNDTINMYSNLKKEINGKDIKMILRQLQDNNCNIISQKIERQYKNVVGINKQNFNQIIQAKIRLDSTYYIKKALNDFKINEKELFSMILESIKYSSLSCLTFLLPKYKTLLDDMDWKKIMKGCIQIGDIKIIQLIFRHYHQVDLVFDSQQNRITHLLAFKGHEHLIQFFDKKKVDFTKTNSKGQTALSISIQNSDYQFTKRILKLVPLSDWRPEDFQHLFKPKNNKLFDQVSQIGNLPQCNKSQYIYYSIKYKNLNLLQRFLLLKINPNILYQEEYPLFLGIRQQDQQSIELLLNHGCDTSIRQNGKDCFQYCIALQYYSIFLILLKRIPLSHDRINKYTTLPCKSIFKAALASNYEEFKKCQTDLIDSIQTLNLKKFQKCIQIIPINQSIGVQQKMPIIYYLLKNQFQAAIKTYHKSIKLSSIKSTLIHKIIIDQKSKQSIKLLIKYFTNDFKGLLKTQATVVMLIISKIGNLQAIDQIISMYDFEQQMDEQGNRVLHNLIMCNNQGLIEKYLQNHKQRLKLRIDLQNKTGVTPLMVACQIGNEMVIKKLISKGADVNKVDSKGNNSLFYTLQSQKSQQIVPILLPLIKNINHRNRQGATALIKAGLKPKTQVLKLLLKSNPILNYKDKNGIEAIHNFSAHGNVFTVRMLLKQGASIDSISKNQAANKGLNDTPLHLAARYANYKVFNELVAAGANITIKNKLQFNAIETAIYNGKSQIIRSIEQLPYFYDRQNQQSLLRAAVMADNQSVLRMLINKKFNINVTNNEGMTPLHWAAIRNSLKCLMLLIQSKASLDLEDHHHNTALNYAAQSNSVKIVQKLVNYGANLHITNQDKQIPIHISCSQGYLMITCYLIYGGSPISEKNKMGLTPCQLAFMNGHLTTVELLIVFGDVSLRQEQIDKLPSFYKQLILSKKEKLIQYQIKSKTVENPLLLCVQFKNYIALKFHLKSFPTYFKNIKNLIEMCLKIDFIDGWNILMNHMKQMEQLKIQSDQYRQSYKRDIKVQNYIPIQMPQKTDIKNQFQLLITQLRQRNLISSSNQIKIIQNIQSIVNEQQFQMFISGLTTINPSIKSRYLLQFHEMLNAFDSRQSLLRFRRTFLRFEPWNICFSAQKFKQLVKTILIDQQSILIHSWFYKYFEPLKLNVNLQKKLTMAVSSFSKFYSVVQKHKNFLSNPPQQLISYCLQLDYLELCQQALKKTSNINLQLSLLDRLPGRHQMNFQIKKGLPIFCNFYDVESRDLPKEDITKLFDLITWEREVTGYIIRNSPHNIITFKKLCQFIREVGLNHSEKLQVALKWFHIFDPKDQIEHKQSIHFFNLAQKIKKHIGISAFLDLFEIHERKLNIFQSIKDKKTIKNQLNNMLKYLEILLELKEDPNIQKIVQKSKTMNEQQFLKEVEEFYNKFLLKQFPEKALQQLSKNFSTVSEIVNNPINQTQLNQIIKIYGQSKKYGESIRTKLQISLVEEAKTLGKDLRINQNPLSKAKLIAILRQLIFRHFKIYPYNTQVLSVLGLINQKQNLDLKGRIGQIKTGQGKSTITTLLACYQALKGFFVDIITTSRYLAKRDFQKYRAFYLSLGISNSHICEEHPTQEHFNGQILFGTNSDFEFSILRDDLYGMNLRYTVRNGTLSNRNCEIAIVDEVDSLFIDSSFNSARLAVGSPYETAWVYDPIYAFVSENLSKGLQNDVNQLRSILTEILNSKKKINFDHNMLSPQQVKKWIDSATVAYNYKQKVDYVKIRSENNKQQLEIVIVDHKNTGRLNVGSRWSNGIHEFVEVKHKIKPKDQSYTVGSLSHPCFFGEYQYIFGLTGTIGLPCEIEEVKKVYKVDSFDVPPHYPSNKIKLPFSICKPQQHFQQMAQVIIQQTESGKPVLVLFPSIQNTLNFSTFLQSLEISHQVLNEQQKQDEDVIIEKAGNVSSVTIATNNAGRGTDIVLDPQANLNGGLHTMFAFYPVNSRVENQGLGRSARQGKNGTCQIKINNQDKEYLKISSNSLKQREFTISGEHFQRLLSAEREKMTSQQSKIRILFTQGELVNHKILKLFCKQLKQLKASLQNDLNYTRVAQFLRLSKKSAKNNLNYQVFDYNGMRGIYKAYSEQQSRGVNVNWPDFIHTIKTLLINQILQIWGKYYTQIIANKTLYSAIDEKKRLYQFQRNNPYLREGNANNFIQKVIEDIMI